MEQSDLKYDLTINAGADYSIDFIYTDDDEVPVDVTGWTVEAQLRPFTEDSTHIDFVCTADTDGFHLALASGTTSEITYTSGVYDVFVTDPDDDYRTKLISGSANISLAVTR